MVLDGAATSELRFCVGSPPRRAFALRPFRGLRFDPATVGDLGTVVSPSYDVLDADTVRDLEAANRRNIVRLILSRRFSGRTGGASAAAQVAGQVIPVRGRRASAPPLRVHRGRHHGAGLIGLVGLRQEHER